MFKAIVRFSIRKKLFVGLTTLFLFIGGIYAMLTLPIDAVPDITNNQVQIVTVSPTLAPQEVEQLITMPIEIAMSNIMNVEDIRSVSRFGLSVVTVVFKEDVPTLDARQLINEQIQTVSGEISPELGTPEMMPITTGLGEIYQYILKVAPGYEEKYDAMELRTIQDWIGHTGHRGNKQFRRLSETIRSGGRSRRPVFTEHHHRRSVRSTEQQQPEHGRKLHRESKECLLHPFGRDDHPHQRHRADRGSQPERDSRTHQ